ncbi:MAG: class I SAM-dependent methyltransferase [Acidimicrobiales bacterium]
MTAPGGWNHNIQYGRELLKMVPAGATEALDVGCGEGWLVRDLHLTLAHVTGIDADEGCIAQARAHGALDGVEYLDGDVLTYPFEPASFDFVTSVASLHHLDEEAGLRRMASLLRPGGTLAVVGLARSHSVADIAYDLAGAFATRAHKLTKTYWETPAPKIWPPPHTYGQLRRLSETTLPGSHFRRRAMWRYVLTWTKPAPI